MAAITLLYFMISFSWVAKSSAALGELGASGSRGESGFIALHAISTAAFYLIVGVITVIRREPIWRQRRLIGWVLPAAVVGSTAIIGAMGSNELPYSITILSAVIVTIGTGFTLYSLRHLGRNFGVISDVRGLVTTGPYRWVRHPLYAGETLSLIGLLMVVFSPITLAAFVVGMSLQFWRAKVEERALAEVFPEYREYAARTPMVIPFAKLPARSMGVARAVD